MPLEALSQGNLVKLAKRFYKEIPHPETMLYYDLLSKVDELSRVPCHAVVKESWYLHHVGGGWYAAKWYLRPFLLFWYKIRDAFEEWRDRQWLKKYL